MLCDNEPAIAIGADLNILKGARHFQRKYHYIREVIQEREIFLKKVHTDDNVVDPFTKPMSFNKHFEHAMAIGIVPASSLIVDVRTYLLGGAIDGSEANGIIRNPKLELESSRFTFDLVPLSYESVDVIVGENWLLRHKAEMMAATAQNTNNTIISLLDPPDPETTDPDTIDKYYDVNLEQEERFKTVKAFHACKQEEGQLVSSYLLKMKSYLDTLECLGYAMPDEHGTIAELHAMLKLHEKGISKKAETPIVFSIHEGKIHKDRKKPQGAKGKDTGKNMLTYAPKPKIPPPPKRVHPAKDSVYHHYKKVGHWKRNCPSYQAELKKSKSDSSVSTSGVLFQFLDGIYEIDMHNLYLNVSSMFNISNKRVKYSLDSFYLWHCRLGHINKKRMDKLQRDRVLQLTHDESLEKCKSCIFGKMTRYPKETIGYYFYYPLKNMIFVSRNAKFFENNLMVQEASGSHGPLESSGSDEGLKLSQEEDTQPSENTSKEHNEVAPIIVEPQNVKVPIRRSARIPQAPDRYGFYFDVEEYELGDLDEPLIIKLHYKILSLTNGLKL
ncbi:zinc finger, CCHC-type containing protein [Tanacetum coccineum]